MRVKHDRRWLLLVMLLAVTVYQWQCAVNPVTGKREFMLMTESDEIALGRQADGEIVTMYGKYDDPELENYISKIGKDMAKLTHRTHLPYSFKVLDTPVVNAFAVPGGYVYFTRGILVYLNNEAEFAGVMGHELGHINARHSAKQYSKAQLVNLGLGIGAAVSEDFAKYAGYAQVGIGLLFLRFSRDNEREADDLGVEYSTKAGYDANGMATFFNTLNRMHPSSGGGLNDWFSTHPNPDDRIGAVKRKTQEWQQKVQKQGYAVRRKEFLRVIDGVVYGEDPRQGYVNNGVFYHPTLNFQFPVPRDWQLNNLPTQVQMQSKQQDSAILFSLSKGNSVQEAAQTFIQQTNAKVSSSDGVQVSGLRAQRVQSDIPSQQDTLRVLSYFIAKDQNIYVFHGLTSRTKFNSYKNTFVQTMSKFGPVRNRKMLDVKPTRIAVKTTKAAGQLRTILKNLGVPNDRLEEVALINGMTLDQKVERGEVLKVLVTK